MTKYGASLPLCVYVTCVISDRAAARLPSQLEKVLINEIERCNLKTQVQELLALK